MSPIKLWKGNKIDGEWSIELGDIATQFVAYDDRHGLTKGWPLERAVRAFLTDSEDDGGLQSVFDEKDYDLIHEACRLARWPTENTITALRPAADPAEEDEL